MTAWSRTAPVARLQHSIVPNDQKSSAHKMLSLLSKRGGGEASIECQLFQRGRCHYGDQCKYRHVSTSHPIHGSGTLERDRESAKVVRGSGDGAVSIQISRHARCERINPADGGASYPVRNGAADCQYYLKTGKCNYGSRCKFNHPFREDSLVNALNRRDCFDFVQKGTCPYGKTCKYNHPTSEQDMSNIFENQPRPSISDEFSSPPSNSLKGHRRSASEPRCASKRSTDEVSSLRDKVADRRQLHNGVRVDQPTLRWEGAPGMFVENMPSFTTVKERRVNSETTDRAEKDLGWKKAAASRTLWADEHTTSGISSRNDFSPVHVHTYDADRGSYFYPPSHFISAVAIDDERRTAQTRRVDREVLDSRIAWSNHLSRMETAESRVTEAGDEGMKREIGPEVQNRGETKVSAFQGRKWHNGFAPRESTCDTNVTIREPYSYDLTTTSGTARSRFSTSMMQSLSKYDEDVIRSRKDLHNGMYVKNDTSSLEQRTRKEQYQFSGSWDAQETSGAFRRHGHPLRLHTMPFLSGTESDQSSLLIKNPSLVHRHAVYDRARQVIGAPAEVRAHAHTLFTTPSPRVYHDTRENQTDQHAYIDDVVDKVDHTERLGLGVGPIGYNYFPSQEHELLDFDRDSVWKPTEKSSMFGPGLFGMQHGMF